MRPSAKEYQAAFQCGKEFVIARLGIELLPKALTFCESDLEQFWFVQGVVEELNDVNGPPV